MQFYPTKNCRRIFSCECNNSCLTCWQKLMFFWCTGEGECRLVTFCSERIIWRQRVCVCEREIENRRKSTVWGEGRDESEVRKKQRKIDRKQMEGEGEKEIEAETADKRRKTRNTWKNVEAHFVEGWNWNSISYSEQKDADASSQYASPSPILIHTLCSSFRRSFFAKITMLLHFLHRYGYKH